MRIYIATTLARLRDIVVHAGALAAPAGAASATLAASGDTAFAVTPGLREWYREGDVEELEYVAMSHAARASLWQLAASGAELVPRRVVVAADVPDAAARPEPSADVAAVRLAVDVAWRDVASVHVDDADAVDDVLAAIGALEAADTGDLDAQFTVDALDDHELQWYAVQEIPFLLG